MEEAENERAIKLRRNGNALNHLFAPVFRYVEIKKAPKRELFLLFIMPSCQGGTLLNWFPPPYRLCAEIFFEYNFPWSPV